MLSQLFELFSSNRASQSRRSKEKARRGPERSARRRRSTITLGVESLENRIVPAAPADAAFVPYDLLVFPTGVSADGATVVGLESDSSTFSQGFLWSPDRSVMGLGFLPGHDLTKV